jgi:hypothetical protein
MLRTYIFNERENNWIEENIAILNHDLGAILDEEERVIHIWRGPKSSKEKFRKGISAIKVLIEKNPGLDLKLKLLDKKLPIKVKETLSQLLQGVAKDDEFSKYTISRFISIRLYLISLLISIIFPIVSLINLASFASWIASDSNFIVMAEYYDKWLAISLALIIIAIFSFGISIIIGILEQDYSVIVFSTIGFLICIGVALYLQQGIFIFIFQEGSTDLIYLINSYDLSLFLILIAGSIAIFEIPNIIKLRSFIKTYKKFIF